MPRRRIDHLDSLDLEERHALASVLKQLLSGYDRLFDTPCPYTLGWHGAPGACGRTPLAAACSCVPTSTEVRFGAKAYGRL
jgi:galactose-1-phosphate uridylyltransferase